MILNDIIPRLGDDSIQELKNGNKRITASTWRAYIHAQKPFNKPARTLDRRIAFVEKIIGRSDAIRLFDEGPLPVNTHGEPIWQKENQ